MDRTSLNDCRHAQHQPWRLLAKYATAYTLATVGTSPLMHSIVPQALDSVLAACRTPAEVRSAAASVCGALWHFREQHETLILLAHEAYTGMMADLSAQAIEGPKDDGKRNIEETCMVPPTRSAVTQRRRPSSVDWVRAARTTAVSLLSDDLPFLAWSRFIWEAAERAKAAVLASSLPKPLVALLTSHVFVTIGKTTVTQLLYETASDSTYLAMQAKLQGRSVAAELRAKLWTLRRDALVYWSAAHMFCFSMPVWWLQPIADNSLTLFFNVYQSLLAHKAVELAAT